VTAVSADTFGDVAQAWFTEKVEKKGLRSVKEVKRHLDTYVLPSWRDLNIHEIKLTRINALLDASMQSCGSSGLRSCAGATG
jgi:hypothetical protein